MLISSSTFDSIHRRQVQVYNRAALELILCILFDNKIVITAGSVIDSPVFLSVFSDFLKSINLKLHGLSPVRLYIDEKLHFSRTNRIDVVQKIMDSYLCGRAQHGSDLWSGDEANFPSKYNFAFMEPSIFHALGRGKAIELLRDPLRKYDILGYCDHYIQDSAEIVNKYFELNDDSIGVTRNVFADKSYKDYALPLINRFADLIESYSGGDIRSKMDAVTGELTARGSFNRNQFGKLGREIFGEQWDEYFSPFVNIHYWKLLSKLCGANVIQNIELWNVENPSTRDSIRDVIGSGDGDLVMDLWEDNASGNSANSPAVDERDKRLQDIDWAHIVELRLKSGHRLQRIADAQNESEYHAALEDYANFLAQELKPRLSLLDIKGDRFTLALKSLENSELKKHTAIGWKIFRKKPLRTAGAVIGHQNFGYFGMMLGAETGEILEGMLDFYLKMLDERNKITSNKAVIKKYAFSGNAFLS